MKIFDKLKNAKKKYDTYSENVEKKRSEKRKKDIAWLKEEDRLLKYKVRVQKKRNQLNNISTNKIGGLFDDGYSPKKKKKKKSKEGGWGINDDLFY